MLKLPLKTKSKEHLVTLGNLFFFLFPLAEEELLPPFLWSNISLQHTTTLCPNLLQYMQWYLYLQSFPRLHLPWLNLLQMSDDFPPLWWLSELCAPWEKLEWLGVSCPNLLVFMQSQSHFDQACWRITDQLRFGCHAKCNLKSLFVCIHIFPSERQRDRMNNMIIFNQFSSSVRIGSGINICIHSEGLFPFVKVVNGFSLSYWCPESFSIAHH